MSKSVIINGFEIVRRHDNSFGIYDYGWWPDEDLDSDPEANARYLEATGGYRKKGWILVKVLHSYNAARDWASNWGKPPASLPADVSVAA